MKRANFWSLSCILRTALLNYRYFYFLQEIIDLNQHLFPEETRFWLLLYFDRKSRAIVLIFPEIRTGGLCRPLAFADTMLAEAVLELRNARAHGLALLVHALLLALERLDIVHGTLQDSPLIRPDFRVLFGQQSPQLLNPVVYIEPASALDSVMIILLLSVLRVLLHVQRCEVLALFLDPEMGGAGHDRRVVSVDHAPEVGGSGTVVREVRHHVGVVTGNCRAVGVGGGKRVDGDINVHCVVIVVVV